MGTGQWQSICLAHRSPGLVLFFFLPDTTNNTLSGLGVRGEKSRVPVAGGFMPHFTSCVLWTFRLHES